MANAKRKRTPTPSRQTPQTAISSDATAGSNRDAASGSPAASSKPATPTRSEPTLWLNGHPKNANYYYDGVAPSFTLRKNDFNHQHLFPPQHLDLSSLWVMKIAESDLTGEDRARRWPAVFNTKTVKSSYVHKGRAAKMENAQTRKYHYVLIFGNVECHGAEGRQERRTDRDARMVTHSGHHLEEGDECSEVNQHNNMDVHPNATAKKTAGDINEAGTDHSGNGSSAQPFKEENHESSADQSLFGGGPLNEDDVALSPVKHERPKKMKIKRIEALDEVDDNVSHEDKLKQAVDRNVELEKQLKEAKDQLYILSSTAGTIYQSTSWVVEHLGKTVQELSFLIQRCEKFLPTDPSTVLTIEDMKLERAKAYIQEYNAAEDDQLKRFNESTDEFFDVYPKEADEIFGIMEDESSTS